MMYSFAEIEALTAKIRWLAVDLLGDRVSTVNVEPYDYNDCMGVAIQSPEGWRHAVVGKTTYAMADPETWTRAACAKIAEWLDERTRKPGDTIIWPEVPPEQPGTA